MKPSREIRGQVRSLLQRNTATFWGGGGREAEMHKEANTQRFNQKQLQVKEPGVSR